MTFITRFAPSPTGPLHLGHAYSAIIAHDMARREGGKFYVRIEDLDQSRSKKKWENQIFNDLDWLGLSWDCLLYTSPSPRDLSTSRMPSSA